MTNPNTAEEIYSKHGIKAYEKYGLEKEWMPPPEWVVEAMQEHTAQTLDRLKEEVVALKDKDLDKTETIDETKGYFKSLLEVKKLIEEVSDEALPDQKGNV